MCKAGFAGDDAPRAVFRKLSPFPSPFHRPRPHLKLYRNGGGWVQHHANHHNLQRPLSVAPATMGEYPAGFVASTPPFRAAYMLTMRQYHDWYGSEGLVCR